MTTPNIQDARIYAAKVNRNIAARAFDDDFGFASHVTQEDKEKYAANQIKYAEEIEAGEHDGNFTVWQRINTFLTGECMAFLPK